MCQFMKVSRSGYYEWLSRAQCDREKSDETLIEIITTLFKEGREIYGTRRIKRSWPCKKGSSVAAELVD